MTMHQMKYEHAVHTRSTEDVSTAQKQQNSSYASNQGLQNPVGDPGNGFTLNYWGAGYKSDELCWDLCWD